MLKILKIFSQKIISIDIVFLDDNYGKSSKIAPYNKIPCITYKSSKHNISINQFITTNNINMGDIVLDQSNFIYRKQINMINFGFKIDENKSLNVVFDLNDNKHLNYIVGILLSKSILIANNENQEIAMQIVFNDPGNKFTNELLPIALSKIENNLINQISGLNKIDNYQNYVDKAIIGVKEGWLINVD